MGGDDISICSNESSSCSKCLEREKCQLCQSTLHLAPACPLISCLSRLMKQDKTDKCQICKLDTHLAPKCPYIYTLCPQDKCEGIRKVKTSNTPENPKRLFLKCQYTSCGSFEWLDLAVAQRSGSAGSSSSSSPKQHREVGCFGCGQNDHWKQQCPWVGSPCKVRICDGKREMKRSYWEGFEGEKYLLCNKCEDFEWFKEALKVSTPKCVSTPARIVIDTTLEDICSKFKGCMN